MNANDKSSEDIPEKPIQVLQSTWWHMKNGFDDVYGEEGADAIVDFFNLLGDPNVEPQKLKEAFALRIREGVEAAIFSGSLGHDEFDATNFLDGYDYAVRSIEALQALGYEDAAQTLTSMFRQVRYLSVACERGNARRIKLALGALRERCSTLLSEREFSVIETGVAKSRMESLLCGSPRSHDEFGIKE